MLEIGSVMPNSCSFLPIFQVIEKQNILRELQQENSCN